MMVGWSCDDKQYANLMAWDYNQTTKQISSRSAPGLCIHKKDTNAPAPGQQLHLYACATNQIGMTNSTWTLDGQGYLRLAAAPGLCITPDPRAAAPAASTPAATPASTPAATPAATTPAAVSNGQMAILSSTCQ
ncbi:MAG: hypothetical protein HQK54_13380 [Oligoflexales bacterium]|nr:hypothetical protein [Oligoflexales bacterium]